MLHYVDSMILQSASVMHIRKVCAAASRRHPEIVQLLLDHGGDANARIKPARLSCTWQHAGDSRS